MQDHDPVVIPDGISRIKGAIAKIIFLHPIKEVPGIKAYGFKDTAPDGMRTTGKIGGIEIRPVLALVKPLMRKGILLHLPGGKIVNP